MSDDHEQIVVRRKKLQALRERGVDPYPNDFRPDHTTGAVHARFGTQDEAALTSAAPVAVAGRILALRDFGKAGFLQLQDASGRLQVHVRRDRLGDERFALYRDLDLGDVLGVTGRPFRTRTGELTIEAADVRLLAKALRPLPEKWHGLQDVDTRYRQRYVDLIVNPDVRRIFAVRARTIAFLRRFLEARGFLEVETPMMQPVAGGAAARPFVTHHNALDVDLYLRVSPELYLKRLVVGGLDRVYEINRNFRNEGIDTTHNPEFTMLEFYQGCATYDDLMALTEEMLVGVVREVTGGTRVTFRDAEIDLAPPWPRRTMVELVAGKTGVAPDVLLDDPGALRGLVERTGGLERPTQTTGELLVTLYERLVEPELVQPVFVCQFPIEVSPLARRNDRDRRFVDRFELIIGRHEIANAFSELNDPADQRARFEAQLQARAAGDEEAHAMDEDYVRALEYGLLPTAGEGIGIDRLVMLLTGAHSIREVILFPHLRPETGV
jgi:lysyl-tRNA synthetase, class II